MSTRICPWCDHDEKMHVNWKSARMCIRIRCMCAEPEDLYRNDPRLNAKWRYQQSRRADA